MLANAATLACLLQEVRKWLLSGGGLGVSELRLDKSRGYVGGSCTSPGDTALRAAYADLSSDKERLGAGVPAIASI